MKFIQLDQPLKEFILKTTSRRFPATPLPRNNIGRLVGGLALIVFLFLNSPAQAQLADKDASGLETELQPVSQTLQPAEKDADSQVWYRIDTLRDAKGNTVIKTNLAYLELQTGMHYREEGEWKVSREVIESYPGGAIARQGGHKVIFAENFNSEVVVDMETRDGKRLQSRVLGLSYVDSASGKSVLLAEATNSIGQIINTNQVLYADAFSGVKASVRFTYTKAGLEQDVILAERPATPESYGLDSKSTFLQVTTEFLSPPPPVITSIQSGEKDGGDEDQLLDFGAMQMVRGKAFVVGLEAAIADEVPVRKQWSVIDGRTILFEEVAVTRIADQLEALPAKKRTAFFWNKQKNAVQQTALLKLKLPTRTAAKSAPRPMRMAKLNVPVKGLVLDYVLLASSDTFTFKGDLTYYVNAVVVLSGTTTIEGGTVVKFLNNATTGISFTGPLVFKTDAYRPAVFTSKDDNSVGETISGSNNNPVKSTGNMYLVNGGAQANISYRCLRFNYAGIGIQDSFMQDVWHCQFLNCTTGINRPSGNILLRNVLFAQCTTCVKTPNTIDGQHLTVNACNRFADATVTSGTIINSILTAVTTLGNVTLPISSVNLGNSSGVYKTIGAGNYYLADGSSHRDIPATDTINAALAKDLQVRTTYAPDAVPNNFAALSPTAQRDTDVLQSPDRGYHYDPLDYCLTARTLANATLQLTGGVAVGVYGSTGIILQQGGNLVSQGSPKEMNRLVRYNTVQEQKYVWGANTDPTSLMSVTTTPSTLSPTLPTVTMRFTEMSFLANTPTKRCLLSTGGNNLVKTFSLQDCQVHNSYLYNQVYNNNPNQMTVTLLNNLLDRTDFTFNQGYQGDTTPFLVTMRNNLVLKSTLNLWTSTTAGQTWRVHDNFFDTVTLSGNGSARLVHTHNGYRATTQISGTTSGNVTITTADYLPGPLGNYYYPTTFNGQNLARLIDVGSAAANVLGLCPFTVRTDQTREGVSPVDIGFHYAALDMSGNPLDNNGNGIPDYDDPPVADPQFLQTCRNDNLSITLTGSGNGCGNLTFTILTQPTPGTLVPNGANWTYTPAANFEGTVSFTFKVNDGWRDSAPATVTIEVGFPPIVDTPPSRITHLIRPISYLLTGSDGCDEPHAPLIFSIVDQPTLGMPLSGTPPSVTYTPVSAGSDSFTFKANDGVRDSATGTASIEVLAVTQIMATCRPHSILLEWTIAPTAQSFVDDFVIKRSTVSGGPYTIITTVPNTTRSFVDTTVTPGVTFFYVVSIRYTDPPGTIPQIEAASSQVSSSTCCPPGTDFWVDEGPTPQQLAEWIMAGSGVTVVAGSANFTGVSEARGTFGNGGDADLPINTGVILSSGDIALAKGPNDQEGAGLINGASPVTDLDTVIAPFTTFTTFDGAVLEFDVNATIASSITFDYVFASEEYPDFENSFDDVVAIFVDGINIALVPSSSEPVSIFTINSSNNSQFFQDNPLSSPTFNIQYNGLTTLLNAQANISAGALHHIKIAIADTRDRKLDSAIFIKAQVPCP